MDMLATINSETLCSISCAHKTYGSGRITKIKCSENLGKPDLFLTFESEAKNTTFAYTLASKFLQFDETDQLTLENLLAEYLENWLEFDATRKAEAREAREAKLAAEAQAKAEAEAARLTTEREAAAAKAEIEKAIDLVLSFEKSLKVQDLAKSVSRAFGFKSTSKKTSNKITVVIDSMIGKGTLINNNGKIEFR